MGLRLLCSLIIFGFQPNIDPCTVYIDYIDDWWQRVDSATARTNSTIAKYGERIDDVRYKICDSLRSDLRRCYFTSGSVHWYGSAQSIRIMVFVTVGCARAGSTEFSTTYSLRISSTRSKSSMLYHTGHRDRRLFLMSENVKSNIGNSKPRHRTQMSSFFSQCRILNILSRWIIPV